MKESHIEGLANHDDPESCASTREGPGEALTGARTGQPLSRESTLIQGADAVAFAEGHTDGDDIASPRPALRGRRPWHVRKPSEREPGDLMCGRGRGTSPPRAPVRSGQARSRSRG